MSPQPVVIYGVRCTLLPASDGGGSYVVIAPSGATLTRQPRRFLAIARAAQVLRERKA